MAETRQQTLGARRCALIEATIELVNSPAEPDPAAVRDSEKYLAQLLAIFSLDKPTQFENYVIFGQDELKSRENARMSCKHDDYKVWHNMIAKPTSRASHFFLSDWYSFRSEMSAIALQVVYPDGTVDRCSTAIRTIVAAESISLLLQIWDNCKDAWVESEIEYHIRALQTYRQDLMYEFLQSSFIRGSILFVRDSCAERLIEQWTGKRSG